MNHPSAREVGVGVSLPVLSELFLTPDRIGRHSYQKVMGSQGPSGGHQSTSFAHSQDSTGPLLPNSSQKKGSPSRKSCNQSPWLATPCSQTDSYYSCLIFVDGMNMEHLDIYLIVFFLIKTIPHHCRIIILISISFLISITLLIFSALEFSFPGLRAQILEPDHLTSSLSSATNYSSFPSLGFPRCKWGILWFLLCGGVGGLQ